MFNTFVVSNMGVEKNSLLFINQLLSWFKGNSCSCGGDWVLFYRENDRERVTCSEVDSWHAEVGTDGTVDSWPVAARAYTGSHLKPLGGIDLKNNKIVNACT